MKHTQPTFLEQRMYREAILLEHLSSMSPKGIKLIPFWHHSLILLIMTITLSILNSWENLRVDLMSWHRFLKVIRAQYPVFLTDVKCSSVQQERYTKIGTTISSNQSTTWKKKMRQ